MGSEEKSVSPTGYIGLGALCLVIGIFFFVAGGGTAFALVLGLLFAGPGLVLLLIGAVAVGVQTGRRD